MHPYPHSTHTTHTHTHTHIRTPKYDIASLHAADNASHSYASYHTNTGDEEVAVTSWVAGGARSVQCCVFVCMCLLFGNPHCSFTIANCTLE